MDWDERRQPDYSGGTTVMSSATLSGTTNSLQGNIVTNPSAFVNFTQGFTGSYDGNMSGGGRLTVGGGGALFVSFGASGAGNPAARWLFLGGILFLSFGFMAATVLESWGIRSTGDFGNIVFNLIEYNVFSKTESDRREDFTDIFDFDEAFDAMYGLYGAVVSGLLASR